MEDDRDLRAPLLASHDGLGSGGGDAPAGSDVEAGQLNGEHQTGVSSELSSGDAEAGRRQLNGEHENGVSSELETIQEVDDDGDALPMLRTCEKNGAVANLVITAVGAGALALPKAFATVGIAAGVFLFLAVSLITYFCAKTIVFYALRSKKASYGQLIKDEFGPIGAFTLQASVCIHVIGVMVIYLILVADLVEGEAASHWRGILPTLLNRHDGPWWLSRDFTSFVLTSFVIFPMLLPRSLTAVARFSRVTVVLITAIALVMTSLACIAVYQDKAATDVEFWPIMPPGKPFIDVLSTYLTVVSVSCLAFTCHFNLIPIQVSLADGSYSGMKAVIAHGIELCTVFYVLVAVSGYVLFGSATSGDVLMNLTIHFTSQLVHPVIATVIISSLSVSYVGCLCVNFVLKVWALRENLCEMVWGTSHLTLCNSLYYGITFGLVAFSFLFSVNMTGIYLVVSVVGSTACVVFSFIFPGLLVLKNGNSEHRLKSAGAVVVILLGLVMAFVTVFDVITGRSIDG